MAHFSENSQETQSKLLIPIQASHVSIPADAHVYALTDIHGCLDILHASLELIRADIRKSSSASRSPIYLLTLGDNIDKGENSFGVIKSLYDFEKEMAKNYNIKTMHLVGNHEKDFIDFLNGPDKSYFEWVRSSSRWLSYAGGWKTIQSYGVPAQGTLKEQISLVAKEVLRDDITDALDKIRLDVLASPQLQTQLPHMRSLETTAQWRHFVFCHAQVHRDKKREDHSIDEVIRGRELTGYQGVFPGDVVVVFGHSSGKSPPQLNQNSIGIDPGVLRNHEPLVLALKKNGQVKLLRSDHVIDCPQYMRPTYPHAVRPQAQVRQSATRQPVLSMPISKGLAVSGLT